MFKLQLFEQLNTLVSLLICCRSPVQDMAGIVGQAERAAAWVLDYAKQKRKRVWLVGHSAGQPAQKTENITLDPDLDLVLDPNWTKILDPDPNSKSTTLLSLKKCFFFVYVFY